MTGKIKLFFSLFLMLLIVGCASTGHDNSKASESVEQEPALFDDWQYKGFGSEYPYWCEVILLEKDIDELVQLFPELKGHTDLMEVFLSYGDDTDSCAQFLAEEDFAEGEAVTLSKTWVKINPYYEEIYVFPYIAIKLYLKSSEGVEIL